MLLHENEKKYTPYIFKYMIQLIFDVPFEHSPYLEKNSKNMSYAHYTFSNKTSHRKVNNV